MIKYHREALRFLEKQEKSVAFRLYEAISRLPAGDVQRMKAVKGQPVFRLRVGKFRILFTLEEGVFFIRKIDSRGDIYKGF